MPPISATVKRIPNTVPECRLKALPASPSTVGYIPASANPEINTPAVATPTFGAAAVTALPRAANREPARSTRCGPMRSTMRLRAMRAAMSAAQ
jgi:hypothetical protein